MSLSGLEGSGSGKERTWLPRKGRVGAEKVPEDRAGSKWSGSLGATPGRVMGGSPGIGRTQGWRELQPLVSPRVGQPQPQFPPVVWSPGAGREAEAELPAQSCSPRSGHDACSSGCQAGILH